MFVAGARRALAEPPHLSRSIGALLRRAGSTSAFAFEWRFIISGLFTPFALRS